MARSARSKVSARLDIQTMVLQPRGSPQLNPPLTLPWQPPEALTPCPDASSKFHSLPGQLRARGSLPAGRRSLHRQQVTAAVPSHGTFQQDKLLDEEEAPHTSGTCRVWLTAACGHVPSLSHCVTTPPRGANAAIATLLITFKQIKKPKPNNKYPNKLITKPNRSI